MVMAICLRFTSLDLISNLVRSRNIMTTAGKCEKVVEKLRENPFYDKYAERIAALQQTSPEEFLKKVEAQDKKNQEEKRKKFASIDTRQFSSALNPKSQSNAQQVPEDRKLESFFKVDLVSDKDAKEIQCIWEEYHKNKEVISATIPNEQYFNLQVHMKSYPTFLFPLPRSEGFEFIMCQNYGHAVHFTPLLAFQVHKENAPECLTMVHYTELTDKGIILMRGDYDKNVLNGQEAQCLANQFQMYYSGKDKDKLQLLQTFNKSPDSFKYTDLISQLENVTLATN
ncbi:ATP synthase mitochondrial F1 complex assembly factor 1 [Leptidea sinapis]|uniref:ATP synthase mitochondrial F1 complex assembly factor 1 n=1 Tax=Leptidea sinapis TaxID=189913 RepID=A0A5E4Q1G2_9NEOP|nr:ATP synthase mitochondrial F1 complex assembly factor 1 [Leptidea sinapis]VVC91074.1 unnamed protein product [Leptidea sinapis]